LAWIDQIELVVHGLRQGNYRQVSHRGQADLQGDPDQFNEKRFVRAMFNRGTVNGLGCVRDYEVPLKANKNAPHGKIDLLCSLDSDLFVVEAKQPNSNESILKAVLEAYTYSSLVATVRPPFLGDYNLPPETTLVPTVLTFSTATSGRQMNNIDEFPRVRALLLGLNQLLAVRGVARIRFLLVTCNDNEWINWLVTVPQPNGDVRVIFRHGCVPNFVERVLGD
jgi:hypothetical protein